VLSAVIRPLGLLGWMPGGLGRRPRLMLRLGTWLTGLKLRLRMRLKLRLRMRLILRLRLRMGLILRRHLRMGLRL